MKLAHLQNNYVIKFGNHWLQTDRHKTLVNWTSLARASRHSLEWAHTFAEDMLKQQKIVEVYTLENAIDREHGFAQDEIKTTWLNKFADQVRESYEKFNTDSMWCYAHMYYGQGLNVPQAVTDFGAQFSLTRNTK
jgi:hypothetical protein